MGHREMESKSRIKKSGWLRKGREIMKRGEKNGDQRATEMERELKTLNWQ